jgi:hypothetical protein
VDKTVEKLGKSVLGDRQLFFLHRLVGGKWLVKERMPEKFDSKFFSGILC